MSCAEKKSGESSGMVSRWLLVCLLVVAALASATMKTRAHVVELIYLKFEPLDGGKWRAVVHYDAGYALLEMRANKDATQPTREWLTACGEEKWQELRQGTEGYLREMLDFQASRDHKDYHSVPWTVTFPDFLSDPPNFPQELSGYAYMRVEITGQVSEGELQLAVAEGTHPSFTIGRGDRYEVLAPGNKITLMTVDAVTGETRLERSTWWNEAAGFLWLGFLHVLPTGTDHLLFIIALFIYAPRWRPLLHQSLLFTAAHSLTLGLMLGGAVDADPRIFEPIIALSIAWVAFEHLFFPGEPRWRRLLAVFGFGLVHGLGFASSLREGMAHGNDGDWLLPLIAANVGIELAQVCVLALCLLAFSRCVDAAWFSKARNAAAVVIGLTGLWWCAGRLLG